MISPGACDMLDGYLAILSGILPIMDQDVPVASPTMAVEMFAFHDQVAARLRARYDWVNADQVHDAIVTAILELALKSAVLDPQRGTWLNLLYGASKRTLRAIDRSEQSRQRREQKKTQRDVAARQSATRSPLDLLLDAESEQTNRHDAKMFRDEIARTDEERRALALWESESDNLGQWANALGVALLPEPEQQKHVHRMRKRLQKRIERLRERLKVEDRP